MFNVGDLVEWAPHLQLKDWNKKFGPMIVVHVNNTYGYVSVKVPKIQNYEYRERSLIDLVLVNVTFRNRLLRLIKE